MWVIVCILSESGYNKCSRGTPGLTGGLRGSNACGCNVSLLFLHLSQARSRQVFSLGNKYCDMLCCGKLSLTCVCVCMQHVHIGLCVFVSFLSVNTKVLTSGCPCVFDVYFLTVRVQVILQHWRFGFLCVWPLTALLEHLAHRQQKTPNHLLFVLWIVKQRGYYEHLSSSLFCTHLFTKQIQLLLISYIVSSS